MMLNRAAITLGSFLAYFVMSAIISPLGVISAPIADYYEISLTTATATFTYLTSGILIGTLIAIFIFEFIPIRRIVIGGFVLICGAIYAIYASDIFAVFAFCLGLIGACCGIELSAAAVVISKSFGEKLRASMLLLTDSFYSIAGVLSTLLAGIFLARNFHWSSAYLLAVIASVVIAGIAIFSKYPATMPRETDAKREERSWPASVHLVGGAMLIYLVGFVTIYSWVPNYAQASFGLNVEAASQIVSRFFLGMIIGQLIMFFLVLKFSLQKLITIYAVLATLLTTSLWGVGSAENLEIGMFTLGLVTGGLFKTVLTFGTTLVEYISPKMVSYLIFHAGSGTAIAPFVSSFIVDRLGMSAALQFVSICYLIMVGMLLTSFSLRGPQVMTA